MLVCQHNCRRDYVSSIAALEAGLELGSDILCLQEPYILREFSHPAFLFFWPGGDRPDQRVLIAVRKDMLKILRLEARSDLISHPYLQVLDIWEPLSQASISSPSSSLSSTSPSSSFASPSLSSASSSLSSTSSWRYTRIINCYDAWIGAAQRWQGLSSLRRRAIEDADWPSLIRGRCLILGDFNAHSPVWNALARSRVNAGPLEDIIERFSLFLNNTPGKATRPKQSPGISIIDLSLSSPALGPLQGWEINGDLSTPSDHEFLVMAWSSPQDRPSHKKEITGWKIDDLLADSLAKDQAAAAWAQASIQRSILSRQSSIEDLSAEACWIQDTLSSILNQFAKPVVLTPFSKRWWDSSLQKLRQQYTHTRRLWQRGSLPESDFKKARKAYFQAIRTAKRTCWESFLQNADADECWLALKYTNFQASAATPALSGPDPSLPPATSFLAKEKLIRELTYPSSSDMDSPASRSLPNGQAHLKVTSKLVYKALFNQSTKKAPGIDRLNFKALRLLWQFDSSRLVALTQQCFFLGHHPDIWKTAKGILLKKPNKPDYSMAKAWRIISLLNCLGKLVEKVATLLIEDYCEMSQAFHKGQMGSRRYHCPIDAVASLIHTVETGWQQKLFSGALFIDVKGAFDHVNPNMLISALETAGLDYDLIKWAVSFASDRKVSILIDGHQGPIHPIQAGIPQGSPVSPILFLIYLRGVFQAIENQLPDIHLLSYVDDIGIVAQGSSVQDISLQLQQAAEIALDWGSQHGVQFDPAKTEATFFTRSRKRDIQEQISQARIQFDNIRVSFCKEATRWLGILLDPKLSLRTHFKDRLQKAQNTEKRIRALCRTSGLSPGAIWKIQKATIPAIALYGAELWWHGQKSQSQEIQKLVNCQARAITGMLRSTPVGPLVREAALEPAISLLASRQLNYTARLLQLPRNHLTREILPISFREGDLHVQPGEQPLEDRVWATSETRLLSLGARLAQNLSKILGIDSSSGFEETVSSSSLDPPPFQIRISNLKTALQETTDLALGSGSQLWSDGSRLDSGLTGAGVAFKHLWRPWRIQSISLGKGKEVFDAELTGVVTALNWAVKENLVSPIQVLLDSQAAIKRLQHSDSGPGQALVLQAWQAARILQDKGKSVIIQWVPGHHGIKGNELADQAAKLAASRSFSRQYSGISIAFVKRACTEASRLYRSQWISTALTSRSQVQQAYQLPKGWKLLPELANAAKGLARHYFQFKTGHTPIGSYLYRIKALSSPFCTSCSSGRETVFHILFACRKWRRQRETFIKALIEARILGPQLHEPNPEARILAEPLATKALLVFISSIKQSQDQHQAASQAAQADLWGWDALQGEENEGGVIEGIG
jgi:ribonuclease HI